MADVVHADDGATSRPGPDRHEPRHAILDAARPSPLEWMRVRRAERESRKVESAHQRVAEHLEGLGAAWRVLDLRANAGAEPMSFLAIGPGGVFVVTIKDHGRSRVNFAGDVVQVDGKRPPYVAKARRSAKLASEALSRMAGGVSVPVMPVLAFAGSGIISVYGMPKGCLVTAYQELPRVLNSRGQRLAPSTVEKLHVLATHPATWASQAYASLADRYRWYPEGITSMGSTAADNGSGRG